MIFVWEIIVFKRDWLGNFVYVLLVILVVFGLILSFFKLFLFFGFCGIFVCGFEGKGNYFFRFFVVLYVRVECIVILRNFLIGKEFF